MKCALTFISVLFCICCGGVYFQRQTINSQDIAIHRLNDELSAEKRMDKWSEELITKLRAETNKLAKALEVQKTLVSLLEDPLPKSTTIQRYRPPQQDVAQVLHNAEMLGELRRIRQTQEQQNWNQQFWNLERSAPQPYDFDKDLDRMDTDRQTRALDGIRDTVEQERLDSLISN